MIRINLIRECPPSLSGTHTPYWSFLIGGVLFLLTLLGSGWWTYTLQIERDGLLQAQAKTVQEMSELQRAIGRLSQVKAQKDVMMVSLEQLMGEQSLIHGKSGFMTVIGESLQNLQIWLDSIQIEDEILEIHGQAYVMGDVEKCLDRLERTLPMRGLPFVEVQEGNSESSAPFSFFIQVTLEGHGVT